MSNKIFTTSIPIGGLKTSSGNRTPLDLAIDNALVCTVRADDTEFERLPTPMRYRASGAIRVWKDVRQIAGRNAASLSARLTDTSDAPLQHFNDPSDSLDANYSREMRISAVRVIVAHGSNSIFRQAFLQRHGHCTSSPALQKNSESPIYPATFRWKSCGYRHRHSVSCLPH